MIVDPTAAGDLQQRVVEQEQERSAGFEDARHFCNGLVDCGDVLEDQACDDGIETGIGERERISGGACVLRSTGALARDVGLGFGGVDADCGLDACVHQVTGELALTGPDVEDPRRAAERLGHDRQDLFDVLRICPIGELVLPPPGLGFPVLALLCGGGVGHLEASMGARYWPV